MDARPLALEDACIMCPRRGSKVCPNCKDARYCSKDCQKLDWKNHKIICPSFQEPKPNVTDPNGRIDGIIIECLPEFGLVNFRRALFFPGGDQPPKGPILVVRGFIDQVGNDHIQDADMRDSRTAADFFSSAHREGLSDPILEKKRFQAIFIGSREDVARYRLPTKYFEAVSMAAIPSSNQRAAALSTSWEFQF
ncbi:uncharacterized protein A1O5_04470 [Cladophialophora psammophila CBS 110553]|uniref:MYND-type domain-containing protein n=1 Tax=Cladophialophora psammophila CBS 110553 TaxID=1182543 RepID=W9WVL1_9EURO|nr:uncharacterized protein A1O5_04470 [Cladophialophora psammophila CBS 110553]EXJ71968.1 hypothetical protein A1O5_04470 [Cladophialophora psammophila CBS 110553]